MTRAWGQAPNKRFCHAVCLRTSRAKPAKRRTRLQLKPTLWILEVSIHLHTIVENSDHNDL
jgi:hypothetical protein